MFSQFFPWFRRVIECIEKSDELEAMNSRPSPASRPSSPSLNLLSHHVMSNISISSQIKSDYSAKNIAYRFVTGCIQEKLCYTLLTFGLSNLFVIPRRLPAFLFAFFLTPNPKPRNAGRGQCPILCWPCQMFFFVHHDLSRCMIYMYMLYKLYKLYNIDVIIAVYCI